MRLLDKLATFTELHYICEVRLKETTAQIDITSREVHELLQTLDQHQHTRCIIWDMSQELAKLLSTRPLSAASISAFTRQLSDEYSRVSERLHHLSAEIMSRMNTIQDIDMRLGLRPLMGKAIDKSSASYHCRTCCEGDYGYLGDLIHPKGDGLIGGPSFALESLVAPYMRIRICRDRNAARRLIQEYTKIKSDITIWPMDTLDRHDIFSGMHQMELHHALIRQLKADYSISALCPLDLLEWSQDKNLDVSKAVVKALGRWLIVETDEMARTMIRLNLRGISGCITFRGNKHVKGKLVAASSNFKPSKMLAYMHEKHLLDNELSRLFVENSELSYTSKHIESMLDQLSEKGSYLEDQEAGLETLSQDRHALHEAICSLQTELDELTDREKLRSEATNRIQKEINFFMQNQSDINAINTHLKHKKESLIKYLEKVRFDLKNLKLQLHSLTDIDLRECSNWINVDWFLQSAN